MIITSKDQVDRYKNISKNLDQALDYIQKTKLEDFVDGESKEVCDGVKYSVFDYQASNGQPGDMFEQHHEWFDIHLIVKGAEQMAVTSKDLVTTTQPYDPDKDCALFVGQPKVVVTLHSGDMLIAFPEDIHQPGIELNDDVIRKAMIKVKVDF